jgi:hypothetical protein
MTACHDSLKSVDYRSTGYTYPTNLRQHFHELPNMKERIERQIKIRSLGGEEVIKKLAALMSKVQSGQATLEEKTELKELKKRARIMVNEVLKRL